MIPMGVVKVQRRTSSEIGERGGNLIEGNTFTEAKLDCPVNCQAYG